MKTNPYIPEGVKTEQHGNVITFEVAPSNLLETVKVLQSNEDLAFKVAEATDERTDDGCYKVWYVFAAPDNEYIVPFIRITKGTKFPSITPIVHAASHYERKIHSMFGLTPAGNHDLRQLILHENWPENVAPLRKDFDRHTRPETANGTYGFHRVEGEGIYEIPVGPIHAGIIEPGHFRFSMAGESIMLLEAKLGYVHKGTEKLFEDLSLADQLRLSEKISGDSSFSHSLAFCQAVEQLARVAVPARALYLRVIYAELERLANHFGDIGAIMLDTGFNFGGAHGARLREIVMRINEDLTGSRFLRGVNTIGGVTKDLSKQQKSELSKKLAAITKDFTEIITIAENSVSVLNRLNGTGPLPLDIATDHGALGIAARAVGLNTDTRILRPYAAYGDVMSKTPITETTGDVHARFQVRIREAYAALEIIHRALHKLPAGDISAILPKNVKPQKNALAIGCVEGWRGEIIHFVTTDKHGRISRVAPRDPSFVNWQVLGYCGHNQVVPDFPLINKSFNLSYTGNDL